MKKTPILSDCLPSGKRRFLAHTDRMLSPRRFVHLQRGDRRLYTFECYDPKSWFLILDKATHVLDVWSRIFPYDNLHLEATDEPWKR